MRSLIKILRPLVASRVHHHSKIKTTQLTWFKTMSSTIVEQPDSLKRSEDEPEVTNAKKEKLETPDDVINSKIESKDTIDGTKDETPESEFSTFPLPDPEQIEKRSGTWIKKYKHAVLLSYSGSGYYGLQRITGANALPTIEEDFLKALLQANVIDEEEYKNPGRLLYFQRAARTDKGVSALRQVLSLKLPKDVKDRIQDVNSQLPSRIKLMAVVRTTNYFDSKNYCDARTYSYMMPTFALAPIDQTVTQDFRSSPDLIDNFNQVLEIYKGTHNYHNFTSQKDARDASACRYIMSISASQPFVSGPIEWTIVRIKGQSFMMHQIRKMIGLAIAIMRGFTNIDTLKRCFTTERIDVPKAPGLGLLLEEVHYDKYNKRYGGDGIHEPISWELINDQVIKFKEEIIYPEMAQKEQDELSMFNWLQTLSFHTYDTIEPGPPGGRVIKELTPLGKTHFMLKYQQEEEKDGDKIDEEKQDKENGEESKEEPPKCETAI